MHRRPLITLVAGSVLGAVALGAALPRAHAQGEARSKFDFEDGVQGFTGITIKDGQITPGDGSTASVTNAKELVKSGSGSLLYSFTVEPGKIRALIGEAKLPAGTQSVRFWVRSANQTNLLFTLREQDGSSYQLPFHIPQHEWTQVSANLNELRLGEGDTDENGKLDVDQVSNIGLMDMAVMLVNAPGEFAKLVPNVQGPRQVWLDDLQFDAAPVAQATGVVKTDAGSAYVVDNFETGVVRWTPVRVVIADQPTFDIFPQNSSLKAVPEAAAPGMARTPVEPGGKGLRFTYQRAEKEIWGLNCSLERVDLAKADRLRLSLNVSRKSALLVQLKEKDGSEYQYLVMPEETNGWRNLDLALTDFSRSDNSQDENNKLDADQIKEVNVLDASSLFGLPGGEVNLDLDAVSFALK